ncbi:MAG TPA: DUF5999 family protein [Trebonia sp.]|nr:DUF5999 family protein [Trebonia sp.]
MCQHQPRCPEWTAPDHLAARIVADQPGQGWSLLCNRVIVFQRIRQSGERPGWPWLHFSLCLK